MKKFFIIIVGIVMSFNTLSIFASNRIEEENLYSEESVSEALGVAGNFNLFVLEDMKMSNTDTEGRLAVSGNLEISNFGIGDKENVSQTRHDLIVGKHAKINSTENKSGNTLLNVNSTHDFSAYGHLNNNANNPYHKNVDDFFNTVTQEVKAKSNKYNNLEVNGLTEMVYGTLTLTGSNNINVFTVDSNQLENNYGIKINVPFDSTVIINVKGDNVTFPSVETFYNNLSSGGALPYAKSILWNLPEAKSLSNKPGAILGSLLAPFAHFESGQGQINGNLIVKSLTGNIESHLHLFRPPNIPEDFVEETIKISVQKIWDDQDNQEGLRPESITLYLIANNDVANPVKTVKVMADSSGNWHYTFTDLDKYVDGKLVDYTIIEEKVDGYEAEIKPSNDGFIITNSRQVEKTEVNVHKIWDDQNNQEGLRPESITLYLIANNDVANPVKTVKVMADSSGNWHYTFTDLDKYVDGKLVDYTIIEVDVKSYISNISGDMDSGFIVTNSIKPVDPADPVDPILPIKTEVPKDPSKPSDPKAPGKDVVTGLSNNQRLLTLVCASALVSLLFIKKKEL